MIFVMEKVFISLPMEQNMKANIKTIKKMVMGFFMTNQGKLFIPEFG